MAKRARAIHQPFEGRDSRGQFTKITMDMMKSDAWQSLTLSQQGLYLYLKSKYREKKINGVVEKSNKDDISLPASEWRDKYNGNYRAFKRDMDALRGRGFIRTVENNKHRRLANIYGLVDEWTKYDDKDNA